MIRAVPFMLACALLLNGCGEAPEPAATAGGAEAQAAPARHVVLTPDEAKQLGIMTAPAESFRHGAEIQGYGTVVSLENVAQLDSEIATAEAAVRESEAAARRDRALVESGAKARQDLETSEKQAASDAAQLTLAQRKLDSSFGQGAPLHSARERAALIARLNSGNAALVHATFPLGQVSGTTPKQLLVGPLDARSAPLPAQPVWDAPADPAIPGRSFYLIAGRGFAAGERVLVYAPTGAPVDGALVPADAIVFAEGRAWAYVEQDEGHFVRRPLDTTQPAAGGYFVRDVVTPGEQVVTAGAGLLLARETAPDGGEAE